MTVRPVEVFQTMASTLLERGEHKSWKLGIHQQVLARTRTRQHQHPQQQQQLSDTRRRSAVAETRARSVSLSNSKPEASLETAGGLGCGGGWACGVRFSPRRAFLT